MVRWVHTLAVMCRDRPRARRVRVRATNITRAVRCVQNAGRALILSVGLVLIHCKEVEMEEMLVCRKQRLRLAADVVALEPVAFNNYL